MHTYESTTAAVFPCSLLKGETINWLNQYEFELYVTLATNGGLTTNRQPLRYDTITRMTDRLKHWDAMINFDLLGKGWHRSPDRIFAFWFIEKIYTNPHWHGFIRFGDGDLADRAKYRQIVHTFAEHRWCKHVPAGTADVQDVYGQTGVVDYVTKGLGIRSAFDAIVLPGQFGGAQIGA